MIDRFAMKEIVCVSDLHCLLESLSGIIYCHDTRCSHAWLGIDQSKVIIAVLYLHACFTESNSGRWDQTSCILDWDHNGIKTLKLGIYTCKIVVIG